MTPYDILMHEHRLIEQVLNCLEKIIRRATADGKVDKTSALEALDFLRSFADACHHGKEEAILFPVMEANGFSGGCSPVAVMLREHELARLYLQGMASTLEGAAAGEPDALMWFVQHSQNYIKLLREHIHKEDICLFPSASHRLTEHDQQQLQTAFEDFEAREAGENTHERCVALANELADRFGVPKVEMHMCEAHG